MGALGPFVKQAMRRKFPTTSDPDDPYNREKVKVKAAADERSRRAATLRAELAALPPGNTQVFTHLPACPVGYSKKRGDPTGKAQGGGAVVQRALRIIRTRFTRCGVQRRRPLRVHDGQRGARHHVVHWAREESAVPSCCKADPERARSGGECREGGAAALGAEVSRGTRQENAEVHQRRRRIVGHGRFR